MSKVNNDLKGITHWLNANQISLNVSKTEFVVFRSPREEIEHELKIKLNGKRLYPSPYIIYLGVLLDEHLSWQPHLKELTKKLNRSNCICSQKYVISLTRKQFALFIFRYFLPI